MQLLCFAVCFAHQLLTGSVADTASCAAAAGLLSGPLTSVDATGQTVSLVVLLCTKKK
jgi:hypothetical protein